MSQMQYNSWAKLLIICLFNMSLAVLFLCLAFLIILLTSSIVAILVTICLLFAGIRLDRISIAVLFYYL